VVIPWTCGLISLDRELPNFGHFENDGMA
jgi:hypothetical protein